MKGGGIDGPIDQLVKARWLAIGLSQTDLAEVLAGALGYAFAALLFARATSHELVTRVVDAVRSHA